MSALIYIYTLDKVILSADTLSVDMDKNPSCYVSKILPVPHLKTVICGTGFRPILSKWYKVAMENIIGFDITALNCHAPSNLRSFLREDQAHVQGTTSVYHFGYSETENKLKGYSFKSEDNFDQKELEIDDISIKPAHPGVNEILQKTAGSHHWNSEEFHIEIIKELKSLDDALPVSGRVGIGGEIQWLELFDKGQFSMKTIYRFPDFDDVYLRILTRNK